MFIQVYKNTLRDAYDSSDREWWFRGMAMKKSIAKSYLAWPNTCAMEDGLAFGKLTSLLKISFFIR